MTFAFDLISDLHVEPGDDFDWIGRQTALYCVVAGDISRDRDTVYRVLRHLSTCYFGVIYCEGNAEHHEHYPDISASYQDLQTETLKIPGVIYLHNNIVVIEGVAFVGTNGWWTYSFNPQLDFDSSVSWFMECTDSDFGLSKDILNRAYYDAAYLVNSVRQLQKHADVQRIVCISHVVPCSHLTDHDLDIVDDWRYNCLGNQHLQFAVEEDRLQKIELWCFGHYHRPVDRDLGHVRYVSNPKGRAGSAWHQPVYHPKRIEVSLEAR